MKQADIVVIGGSAAGIVAAITATRHYKSAKVILIRKEQKALVPCGIPYIFGTLGSVDKDVVPDAILSDVELLVGEVTLIDRTAQTVSTASGETIAYKKLILTAGSSPMVPPILGSTLGNVFTVKKEADYLEGLGRALDEAKDLVVIGGGFIGVEFADECRKRGLNVTIVELLPHCLLLACDEEFCIRAEEELKKGGVNIVTNNAVRSIVGEGKVEGVELSDGRKLKADMVIIGIGVVPNTELAQKAGLEIGKQRGIQVDPHMRTSDPNIFAAGDCAEKFSFFTGLPTPLRLASIATMEARIAAANLEKLRRKNEGAIGVFATAIGELAISAAGLTEKAAKDANFDIVIGRAASADKHPGSMPSAKQLEVKLIFEHESGRLLGGEACGGSTAGEVANIMSALISSGMTADEVATFQLGTHPVLTPSPIAYQLVNAAEDALVKMR